VASGDSSFFLQIASHVSVYFRFDDLLAPPISTIGRDWLQATAGMGQWPTKSPIVCLGSVSFDKNLAPMISRG